MKKIRLSFDWYITISIIISISIGFFIWKKGLVTGIPSLYLGNTNAISGIQSLFSLFSDVNLGEPRIQNSWILIVGLFYGLIRTFGFDPMLFRGIIAGIILFFGFYFIKKTIDYFDIKKSKNEILFIAIGFLFSTFTIIFFEDYTIFVYLYWLLPFKLYAAIKGYNGNKSWYLCSFLYTLFASMINLPFGLLGETVTYFFIFSAENHIKKQTRFLIFSSLMGLSIAILPSLTYTLLNLEYTKYVLASETFYRVNTSLLTYLRGITDWGFFGIYQGTLFRPYSSVYTSPIGFLTFLWITIPVIVILKSRKFMNTFGILLILIFSALILGSIMPITGWIYNMFFSLPLSDIFRNNTKFYLAIYGIILVLLLLNKKTKIASFLFFLAALPTLMLMVTGGNYSQTKVGHAVSQDYQDVVTQNFITNKDTVLLFPKQYMPVYQGSGSIQTMLGYSRPELFWTSKIILNRCIGCGNPLFEKDRNILLDPTDKNWREYLEKYGITKIVYDKHTDLTYYDKTLTPEEFNRAIKKQGFTDKDKTQVGDVVFYSTGIPPIPNLTVCDAGWFHFEGIKLKSACNNGDVTFKRTAQTFYLPNIFAGMQLLFIVLFILYITLLSSFSIIVGKPQISQ